MLNWGLIDTRKVELGIRKFSNTDTVRGQTVRHHGQKHHLAINNLRRVFPDLVFRQNKKSTRYQIHCFFFSLWKEPDNNSLQTLLNINCNKGPSKEEFCRISKKLWIQHSTNFNSYTFPGLKTSRNTYKRTL